MESIQYSFMPVITLGLKDSIGPYALLIALSLLCLLLFFGKNLKQTYIICFAYICSVIFCSYRSLLGGFDGIMELQWFDLITENVVLLLILGYLVFGVLSFIDWLNLKKEQHLMEGLLRIPVLFFGKQQESEKEKCSVCKASGILNILKVFNTVVFIFLFALVLVLIQMSWPKDYYLMMLYYFFSSNMHYDFAMQSMFVYSLVFCVPLFVISVGTSYFYKYSQNAKKDWQIVARIKLLFSALSIALGVGLLYLNLV